MYMKKEKSRDAARCRRGKENYEFYELAKLLPVPNETSSQLDKASIIRLTMSYLQLKSFIHFGLWVTCCGNLQHNRIGHVSLISEEHSGGRSSQEFIGNNLGSLLLQSLDGFMFILNRNGRFLYVSTTVSIYLGLAQVDMIGTSIYNYIHPSDHSQVGEHCFNLSNASTKTLKTVYGKNCGCDEKGTGIRGSSIFVRMKSTLTRRGMCVKSTGYKVVHITGYMFLQKKVNKADDGHSSSSSSEENDDETLLGFAGCGFVSPAAPLDDASESHFVAQLDQALKFNSCNKKIKNVTGYEASEVEGRSLYQYVHTSDLLKLQLCHEEILTKGYLTTPYYRWLLKNGKYVWMQSVVSLIADNQDGGEDTYLWNNYLIGGVHTGWMKTSEHSTFAKQEEAVEQRQDDRSSTPLSQACDESTTPFSETSSPSSSNISVHGYEKKVRQSSSDQREDHFKFYKTTAVPQVRQKRNCRKAFTSSTEARNETRDTVRKRRKDVYGCHRQAFDGSDRLMRSKSSTLSLPQKRHDDLNNVHSKVWFNPPNREVSNHNDLPHGVNIPSRSSTSSPLALQSLPTVIFHHYPLGIDPTLLSSNPVLAKMLTTTYARSLSEPYIHAPTSVTLLPPVFPHGTELVASEHDQVAYCSSSIADVVKELKSDPLRKVNPPNKVVLPSSQTDKLSSSAFHWKRGSDKNSPERFNARGPVDDCSAFAVSNIFSPLPARISKDKSNSLVLKRFKYVKGIASYSL